jgi:hypothetical protein
MLPIPPRRIAVSLTLIDLPPSRKARLRVRCSNCQCHLAVHMPDPELPDRMLGTCSDCKSWYLLDCEGGVMFLMPEDHPIDPVALN